MYFAGYNKNIFVADNHPPTDQHNELSYLINTEREWVLMWVLRSSSSTFGARLPQFASSEVAWADQPTRVTAPRGKPKNRLALSQLGNIEILCYMIKFTVNTCLFKTQDITRCDKTGLEREAWFYFFYFYIEEANFFVIKNVAQAEIAGMCAGPIESPWPQTLCQLM